MCQSAVRDPVHAEELDEHHADLSEHSLACQRGVIIFVIVRQEQRAESADTLDVRLASGDEGGEVGGGDVVGGEEGVEVRNGEIGESEGGHSVAIVEGYILERMRRLSSFGRLGERGCGSGCCCCCCCCFMFVWVKIHMQM